MINKEAIKTAGKVALAVISPPIGLATFAKSNYDKFNAIALGLVISGMSTVGYLLNTDKELYNDSEVNVKLSRELSSPFSLGSVFFSPLLVPLTTHPSTEISKFNEDGKKFIVKGHNMITFNPIENNYTLNLNENDIFLQNAFNHSSVSEARKNLDNLVAKGDISGAINARAQYTQTFNSYDQLRNVYSNAVVKMNDKLKLLSTKSAGAQKW